MKYIPVRELNQHTSAILAEVASGVAITVTRAGRPVARLVPIEGGSERLDDLVALGRATAPSRRGPFQMPPRVGNPDVELADAIAQDREDGRW